jgi:hypothetical protein
MYTVLFWSAVPVLPTPSEEGGRKQRDFPALKVNTCSHAVHTYELWNILLIFLCFVSAFDFLANFDNLLSRFGILKLQMQAQFCVIARWQRSVGCKIITCSPCGMLRSLLCHYTLQFGSFQAWPYIQYISWHNSSSRCSSIRGRFSVLVLRYLHVLHTRDLSPKC